MINGMMTLSGAWHKLRDDPILRFLVVSLAFYGMSTFEGPMMAIKTVNALSHYTDWTIGHVLGHEVVHHAEEAGGQEEAYGVVPVPPLDHGIGGAGVHRVGLEPAHRQRHVVDDVQHRGGQDERHDLAKVGVASSSLVSRSKFYNLASAGLVKVRRQGSVSAERATSCNAGIAQLVEHDLAKVGVASYETSAQRRITPVALFALRPDSGAAGRMTACGWVGFEAA